MENFKLVFVLEAEIGVPGETQTCNTWLTL
jgi:hypothetical protein